MLAAAVTATWSAVAGIALAAGELPTADCPPGYVYNGSGCVNEDFPEDGGGITRCTQQDPWVFPAPCEKDGYIFNPELDRYLKALPAEDIDDWLPGGAFNRPGAQYYGVWQGSPDEGWIYEWRKLAGVAGGIHWGYYGFMWLAEAPGEQPVIVVDPEQVAQEILDGMAFEPLEVGLAPRPLEHDADSIGLVGAPVWMWVTNAGPTTWGPIEESATVDGVTVTVTAEVENVTWDMGDGTTVTCEEPGDPYVPSLGVRPSPNCGHAYTQTSADQPRTAYTVTATASWTATWTASTGAEGTLEPPNPATTASVRIGERQVIETS